MFGKTKLLSCAVVMVVFFFWGRSVKSRNTAPDRITPGAVETSSDFSAAMPERRLPLNRFRPEADSDRYAVPASALRDMEFEHFDGEMSLTPEARAILKIGDEDSRQIQSVVLSLLPEYRESQKRRFARGHSRSLWAKGDYEIAAASDEEVAGLRQAFVDAIEPIIGRDKGQHLQFPVEINGEGVTIVFDIYRSREEGVIPFTVARVGSGFYTEFDHVPVAEGEEVPDRWRHLFSREKLEAEGLHE